MTLISYKLALPAASRFTIEAPFHRGKYVDGSHKSTTVSHPPKEDCASAFLHRDSRACQRDHSFCSERLAASTSARGQRSQSTGTTGCACHPGERARYR